MTFVLTKPQQELVPIMTQIGGSSHHGTTYRGRSSLTTWSLDVSNYSKKRRRKRSVRCFLTVSFVITAVLLLTLPFIFSKFETSRLQLPVHSKQNSINNSNTNDAKTSIQIQTGEVLLVRDAETIPIPYYHQPALVPTEENYHLVLLHGAAFTKEDWKTSGIFNRFSKTFPSIAITALDLPVKADHNDLKQVLGKLRDDEDLIEQLPISALVTPSASGKSITTWIADDTDDHSIDDMEVYLSLWIPVASFSVASLTTTNLQALQQQENVDVLAIYGDKDVRGKKVMRKLRDHAGAKLLELHGGHPVYLDSPDDFVKAVGEQLTINSNTNS